MLPIYRVFDPANNLFISYKDVALIGGKIFAVGDQFKIDLTLDMSRLQISYYAGTCDKNKQPVYFGDFVEGPSGNIFKVMWHEESMSVKLYHRGSYYGFHAALYQVIGNEYETPKLTRFTKE